MHTFYKTFNFKMLTTSMIYRLGNPKELLRTQKIETTNLSTELTSSRPDRIHDKFTTIKMPNKMIMVQSLTKSNMEQLKKGKFFFALWKDKNGIAFFECTCHGRKSISISPIDSARQEILIFEKHKIELEKGYFVCRLSGKVINYLQLKVDVKIKKNDRFLIIGIIE